jgi:hypothetical protein
MKTVNIYNQDSINPVTIVLNSIGRVLINPKESIEIETNDWFGTESFHIESDQNNWKEQYQGRYNQNLILRYVNL